MYLPPKHSCRPNKTTDSKAIPNNRIHKKHNNLLGQTTNTIQIWLEDHEIEPKALFQPQESSNSKPIKHSRDCAETRTNRSPIVDLVDSLAMSKCLALQDTLRGPNAISASYCGVSNKIQFTLGVTDELQLHSNVTTRGPFNFYLQASLVESL